VLIEQPPSNCQQSILATAERYILKDNTTKKQLV